LTILLSQKSKRWVVQYLETLEKKWFLSRGRWYRSITLWNNVWFQSTLNIPILWYANAWTPLIDASELSYWVLPISKKIITWDEKNYFVLRVEWTSMNDFDIDWKIIDNWSYVLIKKDEVNTNNSDAFLFIVNGWATLKKFKQDWDNIYLLPVSKDKFHNPIILSSSDDIKINWKVVEVFNI
jgi:SOS-response transcriptional repressor LexA